MEDKKLKLYFNMVSGEVYSICDDEVHLLDNQQIPLLARPDSNCKKCYGRGHIGFNTVFKIYEPCRKCGRKIFDMEAIRRKMTEASRSITNIKFNG